MKRIVVNGTFDLLHPGHVALLNHARGLGDHLTVAIDADQRVRELKGASRPVNNQETRKFMLENLKSVDQVKIFYSDQELVDIVHNYSIMVKGSDYRGRSVIGENYCPKVFYYDRTEHSTTKTIQDIINRR